LARNRIATPSVERLQTLQNIVRQAPCAETSVRYAGPPRLLRPRVEDGREGGGGERIEAMPGPMNPKRKGSLTSSAASPRSGKTSLGGLKYVNGRHARPLYIEEAQGSMRGSLEERAANSTKAGKGVDSRALVPSSRKGSELTIEALYLSRVRGEGESGRPPRSEEDLPDEGERARLIGDLTRLLREPQMPETTRCAGLTLIGWLARRMPGEAAHAIGVSEARQSEQRLRAAQRKAR